MGKLDRFQKTILLILLLLSFSLSGCGGLSKSPQPNTTTGFTKILPAGEYKTRLIMHDLDRNLRGYSQYLGTWVLKLDDNKNYFLSLDNQILIQGQYKLTGDKITFSNPGDSEVCNEADNWDDGSYHWAIAGEELTLSQANDDCYVRLLVFLSRPFQRILAPSERK